MDYQEIIDQNIKQFLNRIKSWADLGQHHEFKNKSGGFPLFLEGRELYYKQCFFDERIENAIWKYLLNNVLKALFSDNYCSERGISVAWEDMHPQVTSSYVEDIEKWYPIEFTIEQNGKRIAYRYTNWYCPIEIRDRILAKNEIDEMVIIDFSSDEMSFSLHPALVSDKVSSMPAKDFFEYYFPGNFYASYLKHVRKAVAEADKYVGYQTVSNLSSQNLPLFIDKMLEKIKKIEFSNPKYQYQVMNMDTLKQWQKEKYGNSENVITKEDFEHMNRRFFDNERFLAMGGKSDFAHSFITSEYLYETMRDNNLLDFTAIVCGYLKSVEQLLYKLALYTLDHHVDELWIKSNGKKYESDISQNFTDKVNGRNRKHVKFEKGLEEYFDTTFASLVNLLDDYGKGWGINEGAKNAITARLSIYCDECRNEHLHKDNINNIDDVKKIRDNTLLLFYYLLGGYNLFDNIDQDKLELEIINRSFEKIYNRIMHYGGGNYFVFELPSGEELLVAMPMSQENPKYDNNGILENAAIRFVKVGCSLTAEWNNDDWGQIEKEKDADKTVYVTRENVPNKIFYIDKLSNQKTEIEID